MWAATRGARQPTPAGPRPTATPGFGRRLPRVNLPRKVGRTAPRYQDIPSTTIPQIALPGGGRVRVIAGQVGAHPTPTHPTAPRLSARFAGAYPEAMDLEELKALARAAEPLLAAAVGPESRERAATYHDLLSRFRERVVRARNGLVTGQAIGPELEQELRLLAVELPAVRRLAEAAARRELLVAGG